MPKTLAILFAYFLIYVVWGSTYYFIGVWLYTAFRLSFSVHCASLRQD